MNTTKRRHSSILLLAMVLFSAFSYGQVDLPPQQRISSAAATQAIDQDQETLTELRQAYFQTLIEADRREIAALGAAMDDAMTAHDLDEANRIRSAKTEAEAALKSHELESLGAPAIAVSKTSPPLVEWVKTVDINARDHWQKAIDVRKGQRYRITATGRWTTTAGHEDAYCGPDGVIIRASTDKPDENGQRWMYLEGRVGDGLPFGVGSKYEFVAQDSGPLEMEMRDWYHPDNAGALQVKIDIVGSAKASPQSPVAPEAAGQAAPQAADNNKVFLPSPP